MVMSSLGGGGGGVCVFLSFFFFLSSIFKNDELSPGWVLTSTTYQTGPSHERESELEYEASERQAVVGGFVYCWPLVRARGEYMSRPKVLERKWTRQEMLV